MAQAPHFQCLSVPDAINLRFRVNVGSIPVYLHWDRVTVDRTSFLTSLGACVRNRHVVAACPSADEPEALGVPVLA